MLKDEDYDAEFKDECFARLKKIIDATVARIILSSSWRISYWKFVENGFQTDSECILDLYSSTIRAGVWQFFLGLNTRPANPFPASNSRSIV